MGFLTSHCKQSSLAILLERRGEQSFPRALGLQTLQWLSLYFIALTIRLQRKLPCWEWNMCRGCHCKSSLPLILKKLNNFPVLHGVLQINVMITLAWGGMWENTPGAAPFPCESFPSELAITQQLAGVRERGCLWSPATEGLGASPACGRAVSHQGPHAPSCPCVSWASSAWECLCWVQLPRLNMKVSLTLEQRFVLCFTLFWGSGFCSDQHGVGLHVQHVHHLYQQRPWGVAMRNLGSCHKFTSCCSAVG